MTEYVVINDETYLVGSPEEIDIARAALASAGIAEAIVWVSPHSLQWIEENGDPDGVETSLRVLAEDAS